MPWTKRQLIESAFEEAGLATFAFDLTPEQTASACKRLDAMMAGLNQQGVQIGYAMASDPTNIDPDQDSGIPDGAYETVIAGLAIRLALSYGKQISPDTKYAYQRGLDALKVMAAYPQNIAIPVGYPIGAGWKSIPGEFNQFVPPSADAISAGNDPLEFTE